MPAGIVATISSHAMRSSGVSMRAGPERAEEAADDADPVGAEVDEQRERGRDVQRDDEREVERLARATGP